MKRLLLLVLLAASPVFARADILANGNFVDGTAHWRGDAHAADSQGIVIQLDPLKWTKVSQTFNTKENALDFSVTFQSSSECSLTSAPGATMSQTIPVVALAEMTGTLFKYPVHVKPGSWLMMLVDPASAGMTYYSVKTKPGSAEAQTMTNAIPRLAAHEEKTIFLAFPPGEGTITLLSISLTPTVASTSTSP